MLLTLTMRGDFYIMFDSIHFLTISQLKFVSMYIIYPVESFYFVLFSFDNYRFLLFIPNRKCSFVCNFKLYEIIYTTILRSMKMTKNTIAIQQNLLPYFIYMYVIYIFLILLSITISDNYLCSN